jgi:hemolysin activation/secretion protein
MQRHARSYIEGVELIHQRRRTTAIEGAAVHRQHFGNAQMDARLAHRRGVPWLGGDDDEANRYPDSPTFRYATTTLDVAWMQPLSVDGRSLLWNSALRYQWTDDPLYGSEYLAIGSRYTVNGFDGEITLSGEQGGYWRNSLTLPLHPSFMPYAGIDLGHVSRAPERGIAGGTLTGGYLGFRGRAAEALTWDAFVGWSLDAPREFRRHIDARTYGFRMVYLF